ncbi:TRAP transporter substrate-binding protein [Sneathiella sp.]|uniref:TRAP transporter substrate-binding protein n=1 Tax=Sneathiella sp. TaxID=1964365 RepID=UPI002623BDDB|nr:TRAP transporter substrate-binding protein [Sneathiella sp.]MDF2368578.1 TRAP transporter substrate-binding protein [Sneathiella sp.]
MEIYSKAKTAIVVLGTLMLITVGITGTGAAAETKLISGGMGAPTSDATKGAAKFAEIVAEKTGGRIKINHNPGGALGTGQEQMEAVSSGTQQLFISAGSQASRLVKSIGVIDAAFLFKDFDHLERFMQSDMWAEANQQLIDQFGVRALATNWFALPRYFMSRDKFIMSVDDVKGVRTRTSSVPMYVQNYENMGAIPVKVAYPEQYLALSQGVVDLTESAANRILSTKLYEVAPFITECDMMFPQVSVFMNEDAFQKLNPEDQKILTDAANEAGIYYTKIAADAYALQREEIISKGASSNVCLKKPGRILPRKPWRQCQ